MIIGLFCVTILATTFFLLFPFGGPLDRRFLLYLHHPDSLREDISFRIEKHAREVKEANFQRDLASGKVVAIVLPEVLPDEIMSKVEIPISDFARSNRIEILRYQRLYPHSPREVCVWAKDVPQIRSFVNLLKQKYGLLDE